VLQLRERAGVLVVDDESVSLAQSRQAARTLEVAGRSSAEQHKVAWQNALSSL